MKIVETPQSRTLKEAAREYRSVLATGEPSDTSYTSYMSNLPATASSHLARISQINVYIPGCFW